MDSKLLLPLRGATHELIINCVGKRSVYFRRTDVKIMLLYNKNKVFDE